MMSNPISKMKAFAGELFGSADTETASTEPSPITPRSLPPGSAAKATGLPPIPLFAGLPSEALAALVARLERRRVKAGKRIVEENELGSEMFILVRGSARVIRTIDGRRKHVDDLRERSFFGEAALYANAPRLATVEAATDVELLVLPRATLEALVLDHPAIGASIETFYRTRMLANVLRANPRFRSLSEAARGAILAEARIVAYEPGDWILRQGARGDSLHIVLRGGCEVFHVADDGTELRYAALGEGDVVGEISLLGGTTTTANVRSTTHAVVLELSRASFEKAMMTSPDVRAYIEDLRDRRIAATAEAFTEHGWPVDADLLCVDAPASPPRSEPPAVVA